MVKANDRNLKTKTIIIKDKTQMTEVGGITALAEATIVCTLRLYINNVAVS